MFDLEFICPVCDGEAAVLGTLGSRTHCRCTRCGMEFSRVASFEECSGEAALPAWLDEPAKEYPKVWTPDGMQYAFATESAPVQASLF